MRPAKVVRNSFIAGFAILAPLVITAFVLQWLFVRLLAIVDPLVASTRLTNYTANIEPVAQLVAGVVLFGSIALVGFVASQSVGERAFDGFDALMGHVPFVRVIYSSVRQVSEALLEGNDRYESVVLVEYPRDGIYSLGFVTNDGPRPVEAVLDEEMVNVFVPHSPNPTAGSLVLVPVSEVTPVDVSVRKAIRLLVTTGMAYDEEVELGETAGVTLPTES